MRLLLPSGTFTPCHLCCDTTLQATSQYRPFFYFLLVVCLTNYGVVWRRGERTLLGWGWGRMPNPASGLARSRDRFLTAKVTGSGRNRFLAYCATQTPIDISPGGVGGCVKRFCCWSDRDWALTVRMWVFSRACWQGGTPFSVHVEAVVAAAASLADVPLGLCTGAPDQYTIMQDGDCFHEILSILRALPMLNAKHIWKCSCNEFTPGRESLDFILIQWIPLWYIVNHLKDLTEEAVSYCFVLYATRGL